MTRSRTCFVTFLRYVFTMQQLRRIPQGHCSDDVILPLTENLGTYVVVFVYEHGVKRVRERVVDGRSL